jgi:chain length determinant protein EpsF
MNFSLLLLVLRARWSLFALVLAVTVVAATAVSLLLPKTYRATASLLLDYKNEQSMSNALNPLLQPHERLSYMQTQVDIITSEKVVRKVVQDLKLAEVPALRAAFEKQAGGKGSIEDWLVAALLEKLKVETTQSSVINVSYLSGDSRFSAQVANAFAKAYVDTMIELRVSPTRQAAAWFDEQLKSLRASLEEAQAKLTKYHRQKGIVSADERLDVENSRLGELSTQAVRTQDQTFDWKTRGQQARELLRRGGTLEDLPEVIANPHIQKLRSDLLQGEAKLQELATQYGANYPQYQRLQSENRTLREKIDAEMRKILAGLEASARQSSQREAELKNAMTAQRSRLLELKEDRDELMVLTRNVESAQRAYDTALQRGVINQVESHVSQANVTVLNPAAVPAKPYRPRVTLNIALSVAVGTMLGAGIVILMEMLERRVRRREDLDNAWGTPLLGVLNVWRPAERSLHGRDAGRALPSPG